ncbi:hypothetical protein [Stigmatella aurantiaca]|nr:hypothetical protein [Stigmatella aurantiaca]ADO68411.1 uncharacterized protein STAUR_0607 [Stigmatella aurantiaca DW4/3-1]
MSFLRFAVMVVLLAPFAGFADSSDPRALSPPPLVSSQESGESSPSAALFPHPVESSLPPEPAPLAARLMLELLSGTVGGLGLGAAGLFLGLGLVSCNGEYFGCGFFLFVPAGVGILIGAPLGVYGAGKLLRGQGAFWSSFLGAFVGTGLGLFAGLASQSDVALLLGLAGGPVVGGIVGFELSHAANWPPARLGAAPPEPGVSLLPVLAAVPGGGLFGGLAGRF